MLRLKNEVESGTIALWWYKAEFKVNFQNMPYQILQFLFCLYHIKSEKAFSCSKVITNLHHIRKQLTTDEWYHAWKWRQLLHWETVFRSCPLYFSDVIPLELSGIIPFKLKKNYQFCQQLMNCWLCSKDRNLSIALKTSPCHADYESIW